MMITDPGAFFSFNHPLIFLRHNEIPSYIIILFQHVIEDHIQKAYKSIQVFRHDYKEKKW